MGVSKRIPFKLGAWKGELDLVEVRMDDFDLVLEMEFLLEHKVGLTIGKDLGKMKVVNSRPCLLWEFPKESLSLGAWKGELDLVEVRMDDFDMVLEMEFLLEHKVTQCHWRSAW